MSSSPFLEAIAQDFEEDVNAIRIKKLLHFVCYGIWENNLSNLIDIQMSDLIVRLIDVHPDIEELQSALDSIVCRINKADEYTIIANTIISKLQPLYEADTTNQDNQSEENAKIPPVPYAWDPEDSSNQKRFFDIRMKIMQQTNPLRAKILIFSTLYRRFYGHDKDWLVIREKSLDEMLRYLSSVCTTPQKLQEKLYSTAQNLENPQENMQAAKTIIQAMMPCYENVSQTQSTRIDATENSPQDRVSHTQTLGDNNEESEEDSDRMEVSHIRTKQQTTETFNESATQAATEASVNTPPQNEPEEEDSSDREISVLDEATVGMPISEEKKSASSHAQNKEEIESTQVFSSPKQSSGLVHQIADSLRDKLNLEAELQGKVEDYVRQVIDDLEKNLQHLEGQLDRKLANQSAEEQLFWKHKALQEFIVKIQNNTDRFLDILQNIKSADRKRLNLPNVEEKKTVSKTEASTSSPSPTEASPAKTRKPIIADRQKVIALAQQGNPKAIAALANKFLANKDINTLVAIRSGCLHVILESTEKWHPKQLVPGLRKYILELKLNHIELVKIHLREPGAKTAVWTKEFPYKSATGSQSNMPRSR